MKINYGQPIGRFIIPDSICQIDRPTSSFANLKIKVHLGKEHFTKIAFYETVQKFLKEHFVDGKLPSMKQLKSEKEPLLLKKQVQKIYHYCRDYKTELRTIALM